MAYTRDAATELDPTPGGDSVKGAVATKLNDAIDNLYTDLNTEADNVAHLDSDNNFEAVALRINDTANANQTSGITIKETTTGQEIITIKSDITSPMTEVTEADTIGFVTELDATYGGMAVVGVADAGSFAPALDLVGYSGTGGNTASSNLAIGCVEIVGAKSDGSTGVTEIGDTNNLVAIFNDNTFCAAIKGNGEIITKRGQVVNTTNFMGQSSHSPAHYQQTAWDMPSLAAGATATLTVTGWTDVYLGDFAMASFEIDLGGVILHAYVSATNTVTVVAHNLSGSTVNFSSRNVFTRVWRLSPTDS